ncbi:MAG TPA: DUF4838 domain-containing protein [Phycisphaeraceae bacterium]
MYEFLETEMGVRWVFPGKLGEYIPHREQITIGELDRSLEPRFMSTVLVADAEWLHRVDGWSRPEARDEFMRAQQKFLLRHRLNEPAQSLKYGHAFGNNAQQVDKERIWWKRFGKTHPEYFNRLPDGTRRPLAGDEDGKYITMCVSNPALHQQIVADWKQYRTEWRPFVNACENDSPGMCTCERCRSWDLKQAAFNGHPYWDLGQIPTWRERWAMFRHKPNPSLSNRYARFYLAVQKEAERVDPEAVVFGYAYANYEDPPIGVKLNERIIISFVSDFSDGFPWTPEKLERFKELWQGWRDTGARLMLRPNWTHAGHTMPLFYARELHEAVSFAAKHGMIGSRFDSLTGQWAAQGPTLYVLARLNVRPDQPVEQMLDEYYSAFGPAEEHVRAYFDFWDKVSKSVTQEEWDWYGRQWGGFIYRNWLLGADLLFTPRVMTHGEELLKRAIKAAQGNQLAEQRVAYLEKGFRHADLTVRALRAYKGYRQDKVTRQHLAKVLRDLRAYRREMEGSFAANLGYAKLRDVWSWSLAGE